MNLRKTYEAPAIETVRLAPNLATVSDRLGRWTIQFDEIPD